MISHSFINGYTGSIQLFEESSIFDSINDNAEMVYESFIDKFNLYATESYIDGELSSDGKLFIANEGKNIFEKIGSAIIEMIKKLQETISNFIKKISGKDKEIKTDIDKISGIVKKHPELKDDIIAKWESGELYISDLKDIKDIEEAYDNLIKYANKSTTDPDSLKAKFDEVKEKVAKSNKSTLALGLVSAAGILTSITTIVKFPTVFNDVKKSNAAAYDLSKKMEDDYAAQYKAIKDAIDTTNDKDLKDKLSGGIDPKLPKWRIVKNIYYWSIGELNKIVTNNDKAMNSISSKMKTWIDKQSGSEYISYLDLKNDNSKKDDERRAKEEERKAKQAENDAKESLARQKEIASKASRNRAEAKYFKTKTQNDTDVSASMQRKLEAEALLAGNKANKVINH